jgi:hypothetical protein
MPAGMELGPKYVQLALKTLRQAVARERIENYALRLVLAESKIASLEVQWISGYKFSLPGQLDLL